MRAGRLRNLVTIERKTGARDDDGGERVTWATLVSVWAAIEPLNGKEFLGSEQTQSEVTGKIVMRYPVDVKPQDRITYGGKTYAVHALLQTRLDRREVVALVSEGVHDGR